MDVLNGSQIHGEEHDADDLHYVDERENSLAWLIKKILLMGTISAVFLFQFLSPIAPIVFRNREKAYFPEEAMRRIL